MADERKPIRTIQRRPARSGNVSYGDRVVVSETRKTRQVLIPFFIPHSDHTELAAKIATYARADPPQNWELVDQKSITLSGEATRKLLQGLTQHLAVAEEDEDGSYLLIRMDEGTLQLGEHDPAAVAVAITKVLGRKEFSQHIQDADLSLELATAFRGAIRLKEMRSAVSLLRQHLDASSNAEEVYQKWCEEHSWAFGNAHVVRDDVHQISSGDRLDLLLPSVIAGYRDIVELKRPNMPVLFYDETHKNYYFSSDCSKAIGQCHRYLDVLHEVARNGLLDHPEIVAYHPRATIVIGRSSDWGHEQLRALHGLNRRLVGITIMTYDHLLAQGERLIELLSPGNEEVLDVEELSKDFETWEDDPPF